MSAALGARALDPADHCRPAERHSVQAPGDRGAPGQVAPGKPGQSFAGDRARRRHHGCQRARRDGCQSFPVPIRPRVCGLAGDDAAAEFERRQGTRGPDQQARRQIHPQPAYRRRGGGAAPCPSSTNPRWRVGSSAAGGQTDQTCCSRTGQQDRPHRLGGDARVGLPAEGSFRVAGIIADRSFSMRG